MHLIIFLGQLTIFYATRIRAATLLAEVATVRIQHGNKVVDFTQLYPRFSPHFPAIYKHSEQIYELWARPTAEKRRSLVTKFSLDQIPSMTPDSIVLEGTLKAKTVVLLCKLSMRNAQEIYLNYRPAIMRQTPLYRPTKVWKIYGLSPSNERRLELSEMTRNSLGIFIDYEFPANTVQQYVIRSLENDGKPYLVFTTHHFGAIVSERNTRVIVIIEELGGSAEQHHYYGVEFENELGDGFVQAVIRDTRYRNDLITETARKYEDAWA